MKIFYYMPGIGSLKSGYRLLLPLNTTWCLRSMLMCFLTVRFLAGSKQYLAIPLLEVFSSAAVADLSAFRRKSILQLALVDL